MEANELALTVHEQLKSLFPEAVCSLNYAQDPWKLLVMARLSAQCTDEKVNQVSVPLFRRFPTAEAMAEADQAELETIIRPCGLFRMKARSLIEMSERIVSDFGGRVPDTMEDLLSLSGVGRKIANLVLGDIYHQGGIVADTHCIRICSRLGFTPEGHKDPILTERVMSSLLPREVQSEFCHRMVLFGRAVCSSQSPKCGECPLAALCPSSRASLPSSPQ